MAFSSCRLSHAHLRVAVDFFLLLKTCCISTCLPKDSLRRDGNTSRSSARICVPYHEYRPRYSRWGGLEVRYRHSCCYNVDDQSHSAPVWSPFEPHDRDARDHASDQHWKPPMVGPDGSRGSLVAHNHIIDWQSVVRMDGDQCLWSCGSSALAFP